MVCDNSDFAGELRNTFRNPVRKDHDGTVPIAKSARN